MPNDQEMSDYPSSNAEPSGTEGFRFRFGIIWSLKSRLLLHLSNPHLVIEIPLHRLADALLKRMCRHPAQFLLDLRRIDGITAVVAKTVFHERHQLARVAPGLRRQFVDQIADQFHDPQVRPLIVTSDV